MIIVSDASPIIALFEINQLDLLKKLYSEIYITDVVAKEVEINIPDWIKVTSGYDKVKYQNLKSKLDPGEASAIAYCQDNDGCVLIIDERKGRKIAKESNIKIIGLLGIIVLAQKSGKIENGSKVIDDLIENDFRISNSILKIIKEKLNNI